MTFAVLKPLIQSIASAHGYDAALLAAQASAESGFNPEAVSGAGAKGLMQFMDATWAEWGQGSPFDPSASLDAGVRYMKSLMARYANAAEPVSLALAAYNAGETAVRRWEKQSSLKSGDEFIEEIPYAETRTYVKKVLNSYFQYRKMMPSVARGAGIFSTL